MGLFQKIFGSTRHGYEDITSGFLQTIIVDEECVIRCSGYQRTFLRKLFQFFFCLCFIGVPYMFLKWYPSIETYLFWKRCPLEFAQFILIKDATGVSSLHQVFETSDHSILQLKGTLRYFVFKLQRFVWCQERMQFRQLKGLADGVNTFAFIFQLGNGLHQAEKRKRLKIYGKNKIIVKVNSFWRLLIDEIINPFVVFEILSMMLWIFDEYWIYALFTVIVSGVSVMMSLRQSRKQYLMLHDMASSCKSRIIIHSPDIGTYESSSEKLVPGDVIEIPSKGCVMPCDALLLSGSCVINESSLTGESLPVTKVPPVYIYEVYMPNSLHMKHTLFCGTQVLQTRYYEKNKVLAIVTETGSNTAKGQLIRSILYPKAMAFDFMIESIKFIIILFGLASLAMAYSTYLYILRGASLETLLLRTLDLITIVVPPTLPAAMTVSIYYSQKRLRRKGTFCTSPSRILVSGKTSLVCFDKTGTLTEEGMDVWGVLPVVHTGKEMSSQPCELTDDCVINNIKSIDDKSLIKSALASCHSLTIINNQICGEPLDVTMFKATDWYLEESDDDTTKFDRLDPAVVRPKKKMADKNTVAGLLETSFDEEVPYEIGLIRLFPFTSNVLNMTVICRILGAKNMVVFSKGAPEKIMGICNQNTIPENVQNTLARFTMAGFRVIALASKKMPASFSWIQSQRIERHQIEKDLSFIGLLLMQNNLKPQSKPVIMHLKMANIKCVMATGDNIMTAVSVSRDCGLLPPECHIVFININRTSASSPKINVESLMGGKRENIDLNDPSVRIVMEGNTWSFLKMHFPMQFQAITIKTTVFARMSPAQKTQLIETLQELDYYVTMCGDGANDCGALKAAHIGISLSRAEASIAAPFTSYEGNVSCVLELIKEGRCALVTSFGLFNYMAVYSLIQFFSVIILYQIGVEMGTAEFLYVDLVMTSSLVICMGFSGPSNSLIPHRPKTSLLSTRNVAPLLLQIMTSFSFQLLSLYLLQNKLWYVPVKPAKQDEEVVLCWENTVVYCTSCFQYLIYAFLYSSGKPHREPTHKNWVMLTLLTILTVFTVILVLNPIEFLTAFFDMQPLTSIDVYFRIQLIFFSVLHLFISFIIEKIFMKGLSLGPVTNLFKKRSSKKRYKIIENEMKFSFALLDQHPLPTTSTTTGSENTHLQISD